MIAAIIISSNANAVEVRDILEFGSPIPACYDIEDTHQIRLIEARTQNGFAQKTMYGRARVDQFIAEKRIKTGNNNSIPACHWIYAGEARYVAEKKPTNADGLADNTIMGTAYFCMGSLIGDTNNEDKTKPCFWVYMADRPTKNGQPVPTRTYQDCMAKLPDTIDPLNPPFQRWNTDGTGGIDPRMIDEVRKNMKSCLNERP